MPQTSAAALLYLVAASSSALPTASASASAAVAYGGPFVVPRASLAAASLPSSSSSNIGGVACRRGGGWRSTSAADLLTMKVSKNKSRKTTNKSNSLNVVHEARVRSAGRVGTKRFVDPTKLFVGNLHYDADEDDVLDLFSSYLGPRVVDLNIESCKIARDWRTGRSKGYGFVTFLDPMMATQAMQGLDGREMMGRRVNVGQGQRRKDPDEIWIRKRDRRRAAAAEGRDAEGAAIDAALDEAEGFGEDGSDDVAGMLSLEDFDEADDISLFSGDDNDENGEEFEFDGVFEEVYKKELRDDDDEDGKTMNRAQRREASKGKKKRKLPHKGFG